MTAIELINLIFPEHSRTSCCDEALNNGIESDGRYRCTKCMLLEVAAGKISEEEFKKIYGDAEFYVGYHIW